MKPLMPVSFNPLQTLVVLVVGLGSLACSAGIIRHDREAEEYRKLGQLKAFQCMGEVRQHGTDAGGKACAVLIAPQWVVTAGHVAAATAMDRQRFVFLGEEYRALRRVFHPGFDLEATSAEARLTIAASGGDLALIQLDRPVTNVSPAVRYGGRQEVGKTMTKIGYGVAGDGKLGPACPFAQVRQAGNNVVDLVGGKFGSLTYTECALLCDFDHPSDSSFSRCGTSVAHDLEIGFSPGDSGGGWFIKENGSWMLVAITSGPVPPSGDPRQGVPALYGSVVAGMRISAANKWIDKVIGSSNGSVR